MSHPFNSERGLIVVPAEISGPSGTIYLRLALDTGATGTMINVAPLTAVGYDPSLAPDRIQVTTGSGVEFAPRLIIARIAALGQERTHLPRAGTYASSKYKCRWPSRPGLSPRPSDDDRLPTG